MIPNTKCREICPFFLPARWLCSKIRTGTCAETFEKTLNEILKYSANRTKIDKIAKTLTVFDDNGTTPIKVFDLKDFNGVASITEIAERAPR